MKNLKLNLVFIVLFLLTGISTGQVSLDWEKNHSSQQLNAQVSYDAVTDTNGNVYVTGSTARGYDLTDMVTVKYNSAGNYIWGKSYDFPGNDYSVEVGRSVTSYRNGAKTFIYCAGVINLGSNIIVIKYAENGSQIWVKNFTYATTGFLNTIPKVMSDASGNCYVSGGSEEKPYVVKYDSSGTLIFGTVVPKPAGYTRSGSFDMAFDASGNIFITGNADTSNTVNYFTSKLNSAGVLQWSQIFRGQTAYQSRAREIAVGASGNVYVTGEYQSTTLDYLTIKYNPVTGDTIWTRKFNGTANGSDAGKLLAIDAGENIYVSGITNYGFYGDIGTVKYNSSGVQQWVRVYAGPGGYLDEPKDMIIDNSGNIYICGPSDFSIFGKTLNIKYNTNGDSVWVRATDVAVGDNENAYAITLDNGGNIITTGSSGVENNGDFGTVKYNSSGSLQWVREFNGAPLINDVANGTVTDKNGNVYTVGMTRSNYGDNISVVKYNSAGVQKWIYNRGGGGVTGYDVHDAGNAVTVDTSGNVYFTGTHYYSQTTKQDICTGKLDSNGLSLWFIVRGGAGAEYGDDEGNDIAVDTSGNVYVTGRGTGIGGDLNYVTIKYNSAGSEQWAKFYSGAAGGKDVAKSIAVDAAGNVFVTGNSDGTGTGADIATVKYNSIGFQQWVNRCNGTSNSTDNGNCIVVDKGGNAYVGGMITQTAGNDAGIILKYKNDAAGTERWRKTVNLTATTGAETIVSIKLDTSKTKIYAAGHSYAIGFFNTDYTMTKIDSAGVQQWQNTYAHPGSSYEFAYGLALDKNENSYITGIAFLTNTDFLTVSYNSAGAFKWSKIFNGNANGEDLITNRNSIAVDMNGNIFVAGSSFDSTYGSQITTIKYKQPSFLLNLTSFIEGFYNPVSNSVISDTASVYLRSIISPYSKVDSSKSALSTAGIGSFYFSSVADGVNYYIITKHRNSLETWSNSGNAFSSGTMTYNFSTAANKAYGSNLKQVDTSPVRFASFSGDVNQDGSVDVTDIVNVFNDANNFVTGYVVTDVTGDDFADVSDVTIAYNNSNNFVGISRP
ncbi:MAG: SBBP repeat-containing protein [bacterium]|nr:SBBP repeat-containing protein [bacterium]